MEETSSGHDIISDLPEGIIETILRKLPIKDAGRTSILSKQWRYQWASLTELVFDDNCVDHSDVRDIQEEKLVTLIFKCLCLHQGPIYKFALRTDIMPDYADIIDQWLLFLSKDVKELSLEVEHIRVPSSIFSCRKLTSLNLFLCELLAPPEPNVFPCLKYLDLDFVNVAPEVIETGCPLLEKLTLRDMVRLSLTLCAPNLKYLKMTGYFIDMFLKYTPLLAVIIVDMVDTDDLYDDAYDYMEFDKFLGAVPCLERLEGKITQHLRIDNDLEEAPIRYDYLKLIDLYDVSFEDIEDILVFRRLILNSPNLEELRISVSPPATLEACDLDFWEKELPIDGTFKQLKTVKMSGLSFVPHEIEFLRFVLRSSPVLEVMRIICRKPRPLTKLLQSPKASPKAEIIIST